MSKYKIITGQHNPVLREKAAKIKVFDKGVQALVKRLKETMLAHDGLGLAAPQVGINKRVFVMILD